MSLKTIAIRTEPELHAKLLLLAQLSGHTLADELREALDAHIARKSEDVDLEAQAAAALEEIDKDAATRRSAIQSMLGKAKSGETAPAKGRSKRGS